MRTSYNLLPADPAAGADYSGAGGIVPSATGWWRLVSFTYNIATGAQAGTGSREQSLVIRDASNNSRQRFPIAVGIPPNVTMDFCGWIGAAGQLNDDISVMGGGTTKGVWIALPDMWFPPGYKITTLTARMQTNDQLSAMTLWVQIDALSQGQ
jgi:hypothetical protein